MLSSNLLSLRGIEKPLREELTLKVPSVLDEYFDGEQHHELTCLHQSTCVYAVRMQHGAGKVKVFYLPDFAGSTQSLRK